jgi:hypothetical protein
MDAPRRAALAGRVRSGLDALSRRVLETIVAEVPLYQRLPREQLDGEVLDICRTNLDSFLTTLAEARLPTADELALVRQSAARRAAEQVPLEALLSAYHVGGRVGWATVCDEATADEAGELLDVATWVIAYLEVVTSAVAGAYLEERESIYGEQRDARRALVEALLSGLPAETLAARVGLDLAPSYGVVAVRIERSADEEDAGVDGTVASRRKVRRLEDSLRQTGGPGVLSLLSPTGGWVLVPAAGNAPPPIFDAPNALVDQLSSATGAALTAAVAWRDGLAHMAEAAQEADDVLRLVLELGHPPGAYRVDDVLLDYVLTRPSAARDRLEEVLTPLEAGPDLIATLQAYLANDFDRRRTAATLHVHPNTLDYRLRRVAELTGLDPSTTRGLQHLGAALTVRAARRT